MERMGDQLRLEQDVDRQLAMMREIDKLHTKIVDLGSPESN
jgi:hypothetical protein